MAHGDDLIVLFCNSFPPEGGGASARMYNLAVLLRDAGYRVQVVSAMPNYPTGKIFKAYRRRLVVNETLDGIAVRRVWLKPSNTASAFGRGWSMISFVVSLKLFALRQTLKMRPALVIVSSPPLPMAATVLRFFKKHRIPTLLNVSDIWPLSANALGAIGKSNLYRILEQRACAMYQSADAITAQSNETLEHIRQTISPHKPMLIYRNLPATAHIPFPATVAPSSPGRIIYPGLLGHAQGMLQLCEAIDFTALGASLHIYGEGAERAAIASFIEAQPQRGIQLHQPVPAAALAELLLKFHAMLVPLIAPIEGALPSKLFTAAAAGLPVLYSGGGEGTLLVMQHDLGWIAAPGDYAAIAAQIESLAQMPDAALHALRLHIRSIAETVFDKAAQDAGFLRFIETLIAAT